MSKIQIPHDEIMVMRSFPTFGLKEYSSIQIRRLMSRALKGPAAVSPAWVPGAAPSNRPIGIFLSSTNSFARYRRRLRN